MTYVTETPPSPSSELDDATRPSQERSLPHHQNRQQNGINVAGSERLVSIASGAILTLLGLSRRSVPGLLIAGVGGSLIHRGATGRCHLYSALGIDTAHQPVDEQEIIERGIHVEQAMLINRPAEELYQYWRNFENLPRIMSYLESVTVIDDRRSHWVTRAPKIAGGEVEWDAEITHDQPNAEIAWRSLPGSDVDHVGRIRFAKAPGDRGTEVHVSMDYVPPAGRLGHWFATLFGQAPRRQMREDLRNFKTMMEVGELPTIIGQPRGSCTSSGGKREGE